MYIDASAFIEIGKVIDEISLSGTWLTGDKLTS